MKICSSDDILCDLERLCRTQEPDVWLCEFSHYSGQYSVIHEHWTKYFPSKGIAAFYDKADMIRIDRRSPWDGALSTPFIPAETGRTYLNSVVFNQWGQFKRIEGEGCGDFFFDRVGKRLGSWASRLPSPTYYPRLVEFYEASQKHFQQYTARHSGAKPCAFEWQQGLDQFEESSWRALGSEMADEYFYNPRIKAHFLRMEKEREAETIKFHNGLKLRAARRRALKINPMQILAAAHLLNEHTAK